MLYQIYWGDASDQFFAAEYRNIDPCVPLAHTPLFASVKERTGVSQLHLLSQVHGVSGVCVKDDGIFYSVSPEGDYLMTSMPRQALGIISADCVPVMFYDTHHKAIGIAHVGWRGAYAGVWQSLFFHMQREYGTIATDVRVHIGASARDCCYELGSDVAHQLMEAHEGVARDAIYRSCKGSYRCDMPRYVALLLKFISIDEHSIDLTQAYCTMCTPRFFSHRRDGQKAGRNLSLIWLI